MESNKALTLKGIPMYLAAIFDCINGMLPVIIMWLTFLYGAIQLYLVCRQLIREFIAERKELKNAKDTTSA